MKRDYGTVECDICGDIVVRTNHMMKRHKECMQEYYRRYAKNRNDMKCGLAGRENKEVRYQELNVRKSNNPNRAVRICLSCEGEFVSESNGNRICETCHFDNERMRDPIGRMSKWNKL